MREEKWQEYWITADGDAIKVCNMTEQHCRNTLNLIAKSRREREEAIAKLLYERTLECEPLDDIVGIF